MSDLLFSIGKIIMGLIVIKAYSVGSDFSFYLWFKHRKNYTKWYFNRPQFPDADDK